MIVMILEKVPPALRGELTRWLIEPHPGVFVGHINAMVRDLLWMKCLNQFKDGGLVQLWTTNNEQHFQMRMAGDTQRSMVNVEGMQLIKVSEGMDPAKVKRIRETVRTENKQEPGH